MTEAEWIASTDPKQMLAYLDAESRHPRSGVLVRDTARKLRLFACACCRQAWHLLRDDADCQQCRGGGVLIQPGRFSQKAWAWPCHACGGTGRINRSRRAVEVAERYADGQATEKELYQARLEATRPMGDAFHAATSAWETCQEGAAEKITSFSSFQTSEVAALLRCIFGNPFRPVVSLREAWQASVDSFAGWEAKGEHLKQWVRILRWNGGTVPRLAQAIYDGRRFDRMPILADALQEAGCNQADLLDHLRGPGPHARGCHVVDLILGKGA